MAQFGFTSKRGGSHKDGRNLTPADTGDPGAYDPSSSRDFGQSKSFQSSNKKGQGVRFDTELNVKARAQDGYHGR